MPIIHKKAGCIQPPDYLKKALTESTFGGIATSRGGVMMVATGNVPPDLAMMSKTVNEDLKDDDVFIHIGKIKTFQDDDLQPIVLLDDQGTNGDGKTNPLLVGLFEATLPGFARAGQSFCNEVFFVQEYLVPKFNTLLDLCGDDLDKFMAQLKAVPTQTDIGMQLGVGSAVFLCANGQHLILTKGAQRSMDYDWGWVSDHCDYGAVAATPPAKAKGFADLGKMFGNKTVEPAKVTPPAPAPAKTDDPKPADVKEPLTVKNVLVRPPATLGSQNQRKNFYNDVAGHCPHGWKDSKAVEVSLEKLKLLEQKGKLKVYGGMAAILCVNPSGVGATDTGTTPLIQPMTDGEKNRAAASLKASTAMPRPIASTTPIKQPEPAKEEPGKGGPVKPAEVVTPNLDKQMRTKWEVYFSNEAAKKAVDAHSQICQDPRQLAENERKTMPMFHELVGLKDIFETDRIPVDLMKSYAKVEPEGVAVLCANWRSLARHRGQLLTGYANATVEELVARIESLGYDVMYDKKKETAAPPALGSGKMPRPKVA